MSTFDAVIMNPPFNHIKDGKQVVKNLWRQFADKAAELSDTVVLIAPIPAVRYERRRILEDIDFGIGTPCVVLSWLESDPIDRTWVEKFDISFSLCCNTKREPSGDFTIPVTSSYNKIIYVSAAEADKVGLNKYKLNLVMFEDGTVQTYYGTAARTGLNVYGTKQELERFEAYIKTPEVFDLICRISNDKRWGRVWLMMNEWRGLFSKEGK
jgi:hypothetical protein